MNSSRRVAVMITLLTIGNPWHHLSAKELPDGFVETLVGKHLDPTVITESPDGRIFIAEKNGTIWLIENDTMHADPFLQIEVDNLNERGLSGLVFHPDFELNNFFYVYYSMPRKSINRLARFQANGNYAIPSSETVLLETGETGHIHNAGALAFGKDRKLYVAVGDLNKPHLAQRLDEFHGKFLRLNDDGTIPEDNPFYNETSGPYRSIWAYGFRNSFCSTVDHNTGAIYAGDVGLESWEEINQVHSGGNYGWDFGEGILLDQERIPNYVDPIFQFPNEWQVGCAITGITSYTPRIQTFPSEYNGNIFFSDYCTGEIRRFDVVEGDYKGVFASGISSPLALFTSSNGDLYYAARHADGSGSLADNTSSNKGEVWKISYRGEERPPFISQSPLDLHLVLGEEGTLTTHAFGANLRYVWYRDSQLLVRAVNSEVEIGPVFLSDNGSKYHCEVSNNFGSASTKTATIYVIQNTRPAVSILEPFASFQYIAGDSFKMVGDATDAEDGILNDSAFSWDIRLFHEEHSHPFRKIKGGKQHVLKIPQVGETSPNVFYRIKLTAEDGQGFKSSATKNVFPELVEMQVLTAPEGLRMNLDGMTSKTPLSKYSVRGVKHTLSAPLFQFSQDSVFLFDRWQDGRKGLTFDFVADEDLSVIQGVYSRALRNKGIGLLGQYYIGTENSFDAEPARVNVDSTINFNWLFSSPDSLPEDGFSVRWSGFLTVPKTAEYTFHLSVDDGARLIIDHQHLIDNWSGENRDGRGSIFLEEGEKYPMVLEYYELAGQAVCELSWSSEFMERQYILPEFLTPALFDLSTVQAGFDIRPNPASEELHVIIRSSDQPSRVRLHSIDGLSLQSINLDPNVDHGKIILPIESLPAGHYVVSVRFPRGEWSRPFVKR